MVSGSLTITDLCCTAYSCNWHGYENNKQFIILFLSDPLLDSVTCSTAARTAEAGGRQRDRDRPGPASQRFHSDRDARRQRHAEESDTHRRRQRGPRPCTLPVRTGREQVQPASREPVTGLNFCGYWSATSSPLAGSATDRYPINFYSLRIGWIRIRWVPD